MIPTSTDTKRICVTQLVSHSIIRSWRTAALIYHYFLRIIGRTSLPYDQRLLWRDGEEGHGSQLSRVKQSINQLAQSRRKPKSIFGSHAMPPEKPNIATEHHTTVSCNGNRDERRQYAYASYAQWSHQHSVCRWTCITVGNRFSKRQNTPVTITWGSKQ